LFGDWGTSRLYVLGLAFFYTAHASAIYLVAMSLLMTAVAWAYSIICRCFPDGGGVYTAARQIHPVLAVVGATLLVCDYVVTASLSTLEAMHYFGCPEGPGGWLIVGTSCVVIACIGAINWFGAKSSGSLALIVATAAVLVSLILAVACIPLFIEGLQTVSLGAQQPAWDRWRSFVHIVLALSGVEAVANMTGIMKEPVARTSRRTIWPVLIEVAILNLIFGVALNGIPALKPVTIPDAITHAGATPPAEVNEYLTTAMNVLAQQTMPGWFALIAAMVFGLLLLSAANTAIGGIISVLYAMARDRELPRGLTRLNYSGVPLIPLAIGASTPIIVLLIERDVKHLADLYAVGVVGAITINVLSCTFNKKLPITRGQRAGMLTLGGILACVELTIIATKLHAAIFAGGVIVAVLVTRHMLHAQKRLEGEPLMEPDTGWITEVDRGPVDLSSDRPRILLAARGRFQAEYAVDLARKRGATLFAIHIRTLRVSDQAPGQTIRLQDDHDSLEALGTVAMLARTAGVPFVPIYVCSPDIAEEILDYCATFGCDTLIMGKTTRRTFARALSGDIISEVASRLPEGVSLIIRDPRARGVEKPEA
jgi:amino acid transporter/nucleotide-binding universal stress UspA family protein